MVLVLSKDDKTLCHVDKIRQWSQGQPRGSSSLGENGPSFYLEKVLAFNAFLAYAFPMKGGEGHG